MASKTSKDTSEATIVINPVRTQTLHVAIRGTRPLILNRLAEKARRELLLPAGRKTAADRAGSLKHDPLDEFRASPYTLSDEDAPTLLAIPASAFKGAMMTAALDLPGTKKTQIGRLLWVEGDLVPIYGTPQVLSAITRSADMNRTPDVRTRAIVPEWAAMIAITFTVPLLNETSVLNLLAAGGQISGVGDWRPEKGKGTYGQFVLTNPDDDDDYARLLGEGRASQEAAMENPLPYNEETGELLAWFDVEVVKRGRREAIAANGRG